MVGGVGVVEAAGVVLAGGGAGDEAEFDVVVVEVVEVVGAVEFDGTGDIPDVAGGVDVPLVVGPVDDTGGAPVVGGAGPP